MQMDIDKTDLLSTINKVEVVKGSGLFHQPSEQDSVAHLKTENSSHLSQLSQQLNQIVSPSTNNQTSDFQFETVDESFVKALNLVSTNNYKSGESKKILNLENLKKDVLFPNNKLTIDNATYYCTQPFKLDETRVSVIGLVQIKDAAGKEQVFPRLFYLSNSQGTWRTMPGASKRGKVLTHYNKGVAESDTQLPTALNLALLKLPFSQPQPTPTHFHVSDLVRKNHRMTYDFEVQKLGSIDKKLNEASDYRFIRSTDPAAPNAILMPPVAKQPNFAIPIKETEITLPLYGNVIARVYLSNDQSLQYLFYETQEEQNQTGKAFLASVEDLSQKISRYGLREMGFQVNNMDAPLKEYPKQIRDDYKPGLPRPPIDDKRYEWNWDYVRELPIIQAYYAARGQALPPGYIDHTIGLDERIFKYDFGLS